MVSLPLPSVSLSLNCFLDRDCYIPGRSSRYTLFLALYRIERSLCTFHYSKQAAGGLTIPLACSTSVTSLECSIRDYFRLFPKSLRRIACASVTIPRCCSSGPVSVMPIFLVCFGLTQLFKPS